MQGDFEFSINGAPHRAGGSASGKSLLEYLRENLLIAAKDACGHGGCGACSVLLADVDGRGASAWRAVNACMLTLPMIAGRQIWTAEALAEGEQLHPVQEALASCGQFGCGYCLPGVSVALAEAYEGKAELSVGEAVGQAVGNLCRCTGYRPFRDALIASVRGREKAVEEGSPETMLSRRLPRDGDVIGPMAYRDLEGRAFYRPQTLIEALRLRQAHPEAQLLAGGTSRCWGEDPGAGVVPPAVISLEAIAELTEIRRRDESWQIGAGVTVARLADRLGDEFPMLREMEPRFGSPQIRNRATIGGNLASAPHHSDLVPVLLALGSQVIIEGLDGARTIRLDELFVGFRQTSLEQGEVIKAITVPKLQPVGADFAVTHRLQAFFKVSKRTSNDRAIANAAFLVELDGAGAIRRARLCFGGVAAYGARAYSAEDMLVGGQWEDEVAGRVADEVRELFPASSDQRATAIYRNALAVGLWRKFFEQNRDPAAPVYPDASLRKFLDRPAIGGAK